MDPDPLTLLDGVGNLSKHFLKIIYRKRKNSE